MAQEIQIRFGGMADPLHVQINEQTGMNLVGEDLEYEERLAFALVGMSLHSIITASELPKIQKRLFNRILKKVSGLGYKHDTRSA